MTNQIKHLVRFTSLPPNKAIIFRYGKKSGRIYKNITLSSLRRLWELSFSQNAQPLETDYDSDHSLMVFVWTQQKRKVRIDDAAPDPTRTILGPFEL